MLHFDQSGVALAVFFAAPFQELRLKLKPQIEAVNKNKLSSFLIFLSIVPLVFFILLSGIPSYADTFVQDEWWSLRAQGKFDKLAERIEDDLTDETLPLPVQVRGAMELVNIYAFRMVDFAKAEQVVRKADSLNESLFGADYVKNLKLLKASRRFLDYQKGARTLAARTGDINPVDQVFVVPAGDRNQALARFAYIEDRIHKTAANGKRSVGVLFAAAAIAAVESENYDKGYSYWNQLLEAVKTAEQEAIVRADKFDREQNKAVQKGIL